VRGTRIRRVLTAASDDVADFAPGEVVLAAGAWSAACARQLGVRLALQPASGYSVTAAAPAGGPRLPVALSEGKVSMLPLGDRLRFGGTLEFAGLNAPVSAARIDGIRAIVRAYLPRMEPTATVETWRGFRPCTPDSLPLIGRTARYANLSVTSGHGSIGMGLAPACGELLAQILTGQPTSTDPSPYRIGRF
jgi:D-amino-acid dehydrogenase